MIKNAYEYKEQLELIFRNLSLDNLSRYKYVTRWAISYKAPHDDGERQDFVIVKHGQILGYVSMRLTGKLLFINNLFRYKQESTDSEEDKTHKNIFHSDLVTLVKLMRDTYDAEILQWACHEKNEQALHFCKKLERRFGAKQVGCYHACFGSEIAKAICYEIDLNNIVTKNM